MAITRPVSFNYAIIGDGQTTELTIDLAHLIFQQGLDADSMPTRIVSLAMSNGAAITGTINGQSLSVTFGAPPPDGQISNIYMTLGF